MLNTFAAWESIVIWHPVTLPLDAQVRDAIAQMSGHNRLGQGDIINISSRSEILGSGYVVVVDSERVAGLLTERDIVRMVGQGISLEQLALEQLILQQVLQTPITIRASELTDLGVVLNLFQQHHLSHLPIVDDTDRLVGLITQTGLQQAFNSILISQTTAAQPLQRESLPTEPVASQQTEAQLWENEKRWQLAFKGSKVGIWEWDLIHNVKFYSQSWKQSRGFADYEISNSIQECFGRIHPDDYQTLMVRLDSLRSGKAAWFEVEYRSRCKDESYLWILCRGQAIQNEVGQMVQILGTEIDITDRKVVELALKESQSQINWITNNVPGVIHRCVMNQSGEYKFVYISSQVREIFELEPEAVLQDVAHLWERIHPDDIAEIEAKVQISAQTLQPFVSEHRLILPQKGLRWVKAVSRPERLGNGDVVWDGVVIDTTDRKQSEQQLQKLSERLEVALEGAQIGVWEWDYQTQTLTWDDRMFAIYGVRPEDFGGTHQDWEKWVHPDDLEQAKRNPSTTSNRSVKEFRIIRPDRTIRHLLSTALVQQDEQGELIRAVGINLDITERKQVEQQLEELSERLELATQSARLGIWEWDVQSDRFTFNERMLDLYGFDSKFNGTYQAWLERIHPEDLAEAQLIFTSEQNPYPKEFRIIRPDGEIRHLFATSLKQHNDRGELVRIIGVNLDISDRKQVELALEQEVLRRTTIFNTSSDGIHILDQAGNLIEASPSFARMLGYTLAEAAELNVADWDARWTRSELETGFQNYPWDTPEIWRFETLHRRKDGSVFPVEILSCSMEWNQQYSFVAISRDISERKQAEAQLQRTNEELARATRLKDEFLANMSHELRTPLNTILGSTEILQEKTFGEINSNQLKYLQMIRRSGTHLLALINDILDLAKIESGRVELEYSTVTVKHLAEFSLSFVRQQALQKRIQLHLQLPPDIPNIRIDERRMHQVLINLLNNAVKFTATAGQVTLEVIFLPLNETRNQNYLCFNVKDTGIGIDSEDLKKLFQPFVQVESAFNRRYEGTGLGLALVKQIVELHGGQVAVTSEVGVGSCFSIELPYPT